MATPEQNRIAKALEGILGQLILTNQHLRRLAEPEEIPAAQQISPQDVKLPKADAFAAMSKEEFNKKYKPDGFVPIIRLTETTVIDEFNIDSTETTRLRITGKLVYPGEKPVDVSGDLFLRKDD
jgi:hypothetical protein